MKELSAIIRLAKYGILAIIVYFVFITYIFIKNVSSEDFSEHWAKMEFFTTDFGNIAGTFSLAFFIHNCVTQITSNNEVQENNLRDVTTGYSMVFIIYGIVGIFGSIGIVGLTPHVTPVQTICQYYAPENIPVAIVNLFFFFQLSTVLPILGFVCRTQFFQLVYGIGVLVPDRSTLIFNIAFMLSCGLFQVFTINPSLIIGLDGAVCGFFIVYIIPFALCHKIAKQDPNDLSTTMNEEEEQYFVDQRRDQKQKQIQQHTEITENSSLDASQASEVQEVKNTLTDKLVNLKPKGFAFYDWLLWASLIGVGLSIGSLQILGIFNVSF